MEAIISVDLNKIEYELGVSYKEAVAMLNRTVNNLYDVISVLQNRVLVLEEYVEKTQGYL